MTVESFARDLTCIDCGATHPLGYRLQCEKCRGLLELRYDVGTLRQRGPALLDGVGLWRYACVLPIVDPAHRVTLGEGGTPLLECPRLAARLGVRRLLLKLEGPNPTGTVKDRSSATGVGAALQFGFRATSVVSSGNAGSSIAAYSARAGLRSLIFAYARASAPKLLHMAATTTDLVLYQGVYDDLITLWDALVEERLFFDCGASRNAYKHEGKKTLAYEIAEQTGWRPPDVVVAPVAVGETFIATARGFRELREAGWIEREPLMVAAQATRANAVARAFRAGAALAPLKIGYTVAEGLAAGNPGRKGEWVLRLLREHGGRAGDAEDEEILAAQRTLARTEGIWAGPTGVASLAVLERLLAAGEIDPAQTICVIISETGLKTEAEPPSRAATAFDAASLRRLVVERLGPR
jgi:threonine synthase